MAFAILRVPKVCPDSYRDEPTVPKVGIEPTHPKIHDFESCASTSSATLAWLRQSFDNYLRGLLRQSPSEEGCKYVETLDYRQIHARKHANLYNSRYFSSEKACGDAENNGLT